MALETGFGFYYLNRKAGFEWLQSKYEQVVKGNPDCRLNDGRVDRQGRFVVGGMYKIDNPPSNTPVSRCYSVCWDGKNIDANVIESIPPVWVTNSICFSTNGSVMYHTDTMTHLINKFDYDPNTGKVGQPTPFYNLKKDPKVDFNAVGRPDGSIIDSKNNMWNCQFNGKCLQLLNTDPTLPEA